MTNNLKSRFRDKLRNIKVNRTKKKVVDNKVVNKKEETNIKSNVDIKKENNNINVINLVKEIVIDKNIKRDIIENEKKDSIIVKKENNTTNNEVINKKEDRKEQVSLNNYNNINRTVDKEEIILTNNVDTEKIITTTNIDKEIINNKKDEDKKKDKLAIEIIKKIDKNLKTTKNELEILASEFYVLDQINNDQVLKEKVSENIKKIKKLEEKINKIKEKYRKYKSNYYFDETINFDGELLDKILEYKEITSNEDNRKVVEDYKLLESFKYLYTEIDKLEEKNKELENIQEQKEQKLGKRDIEHKRLKEKIIDVNKINEENKYFIDNQVKLINDLSKKVTNMTSEERVDYHIRGLGELIGSSIEYLTLLLVSPIVGLIPGIAISTIATKEMIKNIRKSLRIEEIHKTVYNAENCQEQINYGLHNIKEVFNIADSTLEEITKLKEEFLDKYGEYKYKVKEIEETIIKIDKIEETIISNKNKLVFIQNKMVDRKVENINTLNMVKTLNNKSNN